jgi:hypothetical protein
MVLNDEWAGMWKEPDVASSVNVFDDGAEYLVSIFWTLSIVIAFFFEELTKQKAYHGSRSLNSILTKYLLNASQMQYHCVSH